MAWSTICAQKKGMDKALRILFRYCFAFFSWHILLFTLNGLAGMAAFFGQKRSFLLLFDLANYAHYLPWCLVLAGIVTVVWTYCFRGPIRYDVLDYWIRLAVRYRLAVGMFAYGFIKLFPIQMPSPTLSDLNTAYGDFLPWKIFWLTTAAASAGYQSALGALEIAAGLLLIFRITASFGALLALLMLTNALGVNVAYQIGQYTYSLFLIAAALFVIASDVPRLYRLLVLEQPAKARQSPNVWKCKHIRIKYSLRIAFMLGVFIYAYLVYADYRQGPYLLPHGKGLSELYGYYEVTEFELNGTSIPYSLTDHDRWQNVVFEKWPTMSVKRASPVAMDWTKEGFTAAADLDRNYEAAGTVGRHYFHYDADTLSCILHLQNKNRLQRDEKWRLHYDVDANGELTLVGTGAGGDSVYMKLKKIDRRYLLQEGRRHPIRLSIYN